MCVLLLFQRDSHLFCLATGVKTPPPSQSVRASFSSEMSTCHSDQSHMNSWRLDLKWVHTDVLIMQMLRQDSSFCVSHNKSIITISIHSLSILLLTRTNYNRQLHIWRCVALSHFTFSELLRLMFHFCLWGNISNIFVSSLTVEKWKVKRPSGRVCVDVLRGALAGAHLAPNYVVTPLQLHPLFSLPH